MRRVHHQRREDGEDAVLEVGGQPLARLRFQVFVPDDPDAMLSKFRRERFLPGVVDLAPHPHTPVDNQVHLFGDGAAVRGLSPRVGCEHPLQPAHALGVELVQVAGGDRNELHALQQRVAGILRFLEHTLVELEPAQFAVEVQRGVVEVEGGRFRLDGFSSRVLQYGDGVLGLVHGCQ